jgi:hypothetical protein
VTAGVAFPYALGPGGRTMQVPAAEFLRQVIEQIVLVEPGERVNRPDFGCMLSPLAFSTLRDETRAAVEAMVHGALRHWTGPAIQVKGVDVAPGTDGVLGVTVRYLELETGRLFATTVSTP